MKGGERRGRSSKKGKNGENEEEKNRSCGFLNPYTDENVAEKYGLGSPDTFRRAKEIRASKRQELMQAVNEGLIKVHCAYRLLVLSTPAEAEAILRTKNKKEIRAFMREKTLAAKGKEVSDDDIKKEDALLR